MKKISNVLLGLLLSAPMLAQAADLSGVYQKGGSNPAALGCFMCHGAQGEGMAAVGYPRLAGLSAGYIQKQMQDYASGTRVNPIMQPIAAALTAEEISSVSKALAVQPGVKVPMVGRDQAAPDLGAKLALRGAWERDIPECVACHGPSGVGVGESFPTLAGQSELYMVSQMQAWRSGIRKNDPADLMGHIARKMTDEEIQAVARFFANIGSGAKQ